MPPIALSEHHSKHLLALYGIATPQEEIVTTAAEAAEAAQRIGFPVVAKIASAEIAHKTDVGGVRLNLRTAADVRSATEDVIASVASRQPGARVDGVSIQAMIPSGVELVLGIQQDEQRTAGVAKRQFRSKDVVNESQSLNLQSPNIPTRRLALFESRLVQDECSVNFLK